MFLLSPLLLPLLALMGAASPAGTSGTTSVWHRAQVSQHQLAAAVTSKSYQVLDEILCAILATHTPWCHLFTHEGNTCVLYDMVVDNLDVPPPEDTATPCMTRHRNSKTPSLSLVVTLASTHLYTVCCSQSAPNMIAFTHLLEWRPCIHQSK